MAPSLACATLGGVISSNATIDAEVDVEVARHYLRSCAATLAGMGFSSVVLLAVLWRSVDQRILALWAFAMVTVSLFRWQWIRAYKLAGGLQAPGHLALMYAARHSRSALANGLLWGALILFVNLADTPQQLFVVCLVIVGSVGVSVFSLGPYPPAFRHFVHTLLGMCTLATAWALWNTPASTLLWSLLFLLPIFGVLVTKLAADYGDIVRTTLRLRLEKDQLIASLQEQTRRAQTAVQTKARFLASAAHDLRQPVHALSLYADWLGQEPDMASEIIPKIRKSTQAVNTLFDSLFDMARLDSGAMRPNQESVSLTELVDALLLEFAPAAAEKGLALRVRSAEASVQTDAVWLRRIGANLVSNAIRYTDSGGVLMAVRLLERPEGQRVRFEVWDTGRGIAAADQTRVFDEFYRSSAARGSEQGFGLGLAIANRLTKALGHQLSLRSREGRGTCVTLDLGLVSTGTQSEPALDPVGLLQQARLWIVEPNAHRALGLRKALANRGLKARVEIALAKLLPAQDNSPDVLVVPANPATATQLPAELAACLNKLPRTALVLGFETITTRLRRHWASQGVVITALPLQMNSLLEACADAFAQLGESSELSEPNDEASS